MSERFIQDMQNELAAARSHYPPINTIHEGYAIILEEMDEFWYQVKKRPNARDPHLLYHELIQIAAMCMRTADDCRLTDESMGSRYMDEGDLGA